MTQKNKKRLLIVGGYAVFNIFVMVTCIRIIGKIGSFFGMFLNFGMGELVSNLLASLLPSPF